MFHSQNYLVATVIHTHSPRSQICVYIETLSGPKKKIWTALNFVCQGLLSACHLGHECHRFVSPALGCQFDRSLGRVQSHQHAVERAKASLRFRQWNPHCSTIQVVLYAQYRPSIPARWITRKVCFRTNATLPFLPLYGPRKIKSLVAVDGSSGMIIYCYL